ncbi:MAG: PadR family transcriptional regulator [Nitrososphaerota archaeon]|nr:PadR family transcriptional regulator [Candidatus Bathyarchaeota archaeon]MDW8048267.1 PadR family transcriptional regulator [Nitrososphaerota archaeon]
MFEVSRPSRRWLRYVASVPRGFLRYQVLRLLKEKPMSGSEIMEEIERQTEGRWKPGPGSVYPLLAWLQDKGYTRKLHEEGDGIKRYILTEKGEEFLREQMKLREILQERMDFLAPLIFVGFWPEHLQELREPVRRLIRSLLVLRRTLQENPDRQSVQEIKDFLNVASEEIERLSKKVGQK